PDQFGHFIAVAFAVAFGALIAATRPRARAIAGAGALGALGIAGLVATRGSLVGIAGAVAGAVAVRRPAGRAVPAGGAGAVGLAALLVVVGLGTVELVALARTRPEAGLPLLVGWSAHWANALVDVGSVGVGWFPWLALGVAAALRGTKDESTSRRVPRWVPAAIAVVAIAGIATGTRAFAANRESWAAAEAAHFGDRRAATALAHRVTASDAGRDAYMDGLAVASGT